MQSSHFDVRRHSSSDKTPKPACIPCAADSRQKCHQLGPQAAAVDRIVVNGQKEPLCRSSLKLTIEPPSLIVEMHDEHDGCTELKHCWE